jgi:hypothetical protein
MTTECYARMVLLSMPCEEKANLMAVFSNATAAYSAAVKELAANTGTTSVERYQALMRHANSMRLLCEGARLQLENHTAAHGC